MTEAVFANGLSKRYGERLALDRLSLSLSPGSVFGFLGPNGAGKQDGGLFGGRVSTAALCVKGADKNYEKGVSGNGTP